MPWNQRRSKKLRDIKRFSVDLEELLLGGQFTEVALNSLLIGSYDLGGGLFLLPDLLLLLLRFLELPLALPPQLVKPFAAVIVIGELDELQPVVARHRRTQDSLEPIVLGLAEVVADSFNVLDPMILQEVPEHGFARTLETR